MSKFAENTRVPVGRSRDEIERTLQRYGADGFYYGSDSSGAAIAFKYQNRAIKFNLPLPKRDDFRSTKTGEQDWERAVRRLWRVLLLALKAKLELVDSGLTSFEDEFLAQTCLPEGDTVSERLQEKLTAMLDGGKTPPLLTGATHDNPRRR